MEHLLLVRAAITPKQLQHRLMTAKNIAFLFLERKRMSCEASADLIVGRSVTKCGKMHGHDARKQTPMYLKCLKSCHAYCQLSVLKHVRPNGSAGRCRRRNAECCIGLLCMAMKE